MSKLHVDRGDVSLHGRFREPDFTLVKDPSLADGLFKHLRRWGLTTSNMSVDPSPATLGDAKAVCHFPKYGTTISVFADRVELNCTVLAKEYVDSVADIALAVLKALGELRPSLAYEAFWSALALHGTIQGIKTQDFVSRFTSNTPSGLGQPTGAGVAFYFGPSDNRLASSVTVDMSAAVADGLFLRMQTSWNGLIVESSDIARLVNEFARQVLRSLGLQPESDP